MYLYIFKQDNRKQQDPDQPALFTYFFWKIRTDTSCHYSPIELSKPEDISNKSSQTVILQ